MKKNRVMIDTKNIKERITINSAICHGKPTIRNKRYTVESILEYLAGGNTIKEILEEFDDLERDDILACLTYAAMMIKDKSVKVLPNEVSS